MKWDHTLINRLFYDKDPLEGLDEVMSYYDRYYDDGVIVTGKDIDRERIPYHLKDLVVGYVLNKVADDNEIVARLFGASGKNYAMPARLQFFDLFVTEDTKNNFNAIETDTYIGEVKFENTINRASGVANPRQIERVPAGAEFDFKLVYNVENLQDVQEDLETLAEGFELLANDYLGGHGSRGYGRVRLHDIKLRVIGKLDIDLVAYEDLFKG